MEAWGNVLGGVLELEGRVHERCWIRWAQGSQWSRCGDGRSEATVSTEVLVPMELIVPMEAKDPMGALVPTGEVTFGRPTRRIA